MYKEILKSLFIFIFLRPYLVAGFSHNNNSSQPLPGCLAPCILKIALGEGQCRLDNYGPCYCTNVAMQRDLSACVRTHCSIEDQSTLGQELCRDYPKETRIAYVLSMGITFFVITMIFLALRVYTRFKTLRKLWPDDYVALFSGACLIVAAACELYACFMGYGNHLWNLTIGNDVYLLKALYSLQVFYIAIQSSSKISLLLMFKRIYPPPRFRLCCDIGVVFVSLHALAFTIAVVFQCYPIRTFWDLKIHGKCLNSAAIGYSGAAFSIMEDFIILAMPIPQLLRLQVKRDQKIALILLFSVGSLYVLSYFIIFYCPDQTTLFMVLLLTYNYSFVNSACIVSIVRLKYLKNLKPSSDLTWENVDLLVWSVLEVEMTLICACLPTLRPLFLEIIPSAWRTTVRSSSYNTAINNTSRLYPSVESKKQYSDLNVSIANDTHDPHVTVTTTIETYPHSSKSSYKNISMP